MGWQELIVGADERELVQRFALIDGLGGLGVILYAGAGVVTEVVGVSLDDVAIAPSAPIVLAAIATVVVSVTAHLTVPERWVAVRWGWQAALARFGTLVLLGFAALILAFVGSIALCEGGGKFCNQDANVAGGLAAFAGAGTSAGLASWLLIPHGRVWWHLTGWGTLAAITVGAQLGSL